eukprot:3155101-Pyramimonas_sp.AAC.1
MALEQVGFALGRSKLQGSFGMTVATFPDQCHRSQLRTTRLRRILPRGQGARRTSSECEVRRVCRRPAPPPHPDADPSEAP